MKTKIFVIILTLVVCGLVIQPIFGGPTASREPTSATVKKTKLPATKKPTKVSDPVATKKQKVTLPKTPKASKVLVLKMPSKVTGISVSPKNPMVGQKVKVTIQGTPEDGDCQLFIYKDATGMAPAYKYGDSKGFPYSAPSSNLWPQYDEPGTYLVKVKGKNTLKTKCNGVAQTVIHVKPEMGLMHDKLKANQKTKLKAAAIEGLRPETPSKPMSGPSAPTLQKSEPLVMHKTVNAEQIKEMIENAPFNANVNVTPRADGVEFHMLGSKETRWQVRLYTQGLTISQYCESLPGINFETDDFLAVQQSVGMYTEWSTVIPVDPNRTFKYEICPIQYKDEWRFEGQAQSLGRTVEVIVGEVTITDDGDSGTKGAGDLWFSIKVNDQMTGTPAEIQDASHFYEIDTGNSKTLNEKFTFDDPKGDHLDFRMFVGDCDMMSNSDCGMNEGNYEDWALLSKSINTIPAGNAEETKVYDWTAAHHGVGFDVKVTVTIK